MCHVGHPQVKGRMWITKEQAKAKDKSMKGHGDKRQFTLLATTAATGESLKHQVVVQGKTTGCLPNFGVKYNLSVNALNTKGTQSVCFVMGSVVAAVINIASFCCTANHWSDNVTSRAYVKDVAVPYLKEKIAALRAADESSCKPFGEQVCVLILDCWWGWLDAGFKAWVAEKYPWIRLLFVPGACTPVAQPMDAGIIAKIKGFLRKMYGSWVVVLVQEQIKKGVKSEEIKVPADVPTCKKNLFEWLSQSVDQLNKDTSGVAHCWEETQLLRAWERSVQVEASGKVKELFPNLTDADRVIIDMTGAEDEGAGDLGVPFTETQDDEEWVGWVDWGQVEQMTGGAGGSGDAGA